MNKEAKIILAIASLFAGLVLLRLNFRPSSNVQNETQNETAQIEKNDSTHETPAQGEVAIKQVRPRTPPQKPEVIQSAEQILSFKVKAGQTEEQKEIESLNLYARALYVYSSNNQRPESLVKKLAAGGLKPLVVQDFNDVTGKMIVIRTDETLPGTRYFHAQYFEDENKQPFLQHMSFEFKPGPDAYPNALAAIQKQFPKEIGEARHCSDDFTAWEWGQMTIWCHKMSKEDTESTDPTRAYSKDDVGTIRCAAEQNPHPQDDLCGG